MPAMTIRLNDDIHQKLRWLSYRDQVSQHAIILRILEEALKDVSVPKEDGQ